MQLLLAPMEGVLDHHLRELITAQGGFDACVTEFVRVSDGLLPRRVFRRYCPELEHGGHTPGGIPVYLQLLGSDPGLMAENAQRAVEMGAPGIDLNFGCPAKTVNRHGGGASLLREPERIFTIVETVRRALPESIPLSAKMRLGYDDTGETLAIASGIEAAGAAWLTVHARTRAQGYRPPAEWEWLGRIREAVSIQVIANGDINSPEDYQRCHELSGCDAAMLGRGALADPSLAAAIRHGSSRAGWEEQLHLLHAFCERMQGDYEPHVINMRLKQWLGFLRQRHPEAAARFDLAKRQADPQTLLQTLAEAA